MHEEKYEVLLPPLPDPLEINWPELNSNALGCGVEDRGIRDRYDAAEYGWQDGVDKAIERVPEAIYDAEQMREYGQQCAEAARQARQPTTEVELPEGWKIVPRKLTDEQAREIVYSINRKYKGNPMSDYLARAVWEWGIYASPNPPAEAARQPASVVAVKTWQERMKTTKLTWKTGDGKLAAEFQLMADEIADLRAALAEIAAPVLSDEQILTIAKKELGHWNYEDDVVAFAQAILAATRSQP